MAPWFGPKTIGYGIGPASWQGWLVCALAVAVAAAAALVMARSPGLPRWLPLGVMVLDLAAFVGVIAFKTEGG
jgi:ABC-type Fe3+ transport system permease subunit